MVQKDMLNQGVNFLIYKLERKQNELISTHAQWAWTTNNDQCKIKLLINFSHSHALSSDVTPIAMVGSYPETLGFSTKDSIFLSLDLIKVFL